MRDEKMKREESHRVHRIKERKAKETEEEETTVHVPGGNRGRKARKGLSFVYNTSLYAKLGGCCRQHRHETGIDLLI